MHCRLLIALLPAVSALGAGHSWSRRSAVRVASVAGAAAATAVAPAHAEPAAAPALPAAPLPALPKLGTAWGATDGLNGDDFVAFDESAYKAMADDARRTPLFEEAIRRRLRGNEGQLIVLDIGTGPFALLALMAARAGAKKVYAMEAHAEAARRARAAINRATDVPAGTVEVLEVGLAFLSASYDSSIHPPDDATAVCTLKAFPYERHAVGTAPLFFSS
jgi:hypothetical protein